MAIYWNASAYYSVTYSHDDICKHTYYSRFIPEGVVETSQIHRDTHILPK
jgi:hypothetical protein